MSRTDNIRRWLNKPVFPLDRGIIVAWAMLSVYLIISAYITVPLAIQIPGLIVLLVVVFIPVPRKAKADAKADDAEDQEMLPQVTVKQLKLMARCKEGDLHAVLELWESIYGKPPEDHLSVQDIFDEISVALNGMSS
jgi:hypothetical protein